MYSFLIVLGVLALLTLCGAIATIVGYLQYYDKNRRLPDACLYEDLKAKNNILKTENSELKSENAELAFISDEAKTKKKWLEENQSLLYSVEMDRRKQETAKAEYEGLLDKLAVTIQQIDEKDKTVGELTANESMLTSLVQQKENLVDSLDNQITQKTEQNANLESQNVALKETYDTFYNRNEQLQADLTDTTKKLSALESKINTENQNFIDISKKVGELTVNESMLTSLVQQKENLVDSLDKQITQKTEQNANLESQNAALKETYDTFYNRNEQLQAALTDMTQKLTALESKIDAGNQNFIKISADVESYERRKSELEPTVQKLTDKLDAIRTETNELASRNAALMKENETWLIENEAAVRKLREIQEDIGAKSDELQNIAAEHASKMSDLAIYETRKATLLKEIEILEKSKSDITEATGAHSDAETLKDLWEPIAFPNLLPPKKETSEIDLLEETKAYIKGKKLYFPDRVIHAFHTSMKCNDISPITVLAGISGTGKSELPRCYAEGMGIHFSMLAVQPRWDSPRDLLGFYNYMENKYKATELARALVRFDMYNRASWGEIPEECDDRSDRMLLVLLDEMNLARVEYYFSEFLSKLESRRGVDLNDKMDRVKAEIELELIGRKPLSIFPGRNILFTGTMNEDESTQTLSDKVLDRANVLRFGKPKSSAISSKLKNSDYLPPRKSGMTYQTWNTWCVDSKEVKTDDQVLEWINRLNDAMEELQKPFGHRVAQAIAAYVANYPKGVAGGQEKKLAFADQIEQRIMPKLRGIELEQFDAPLKKICALIYETNDTALAKAFERGSDPDNYNGVFMWQGIDRSEEI